jgi:hypothetical protein
LREDFETALQGNNLKEADLKTLTGGARIANIFRERFPFELVKVRRPIIRSPTLICDSDEFRWNYVIKTCATKQW